MANTYYVVMSLGYEFNDEIHYRPESGGGDPLKIFTDKGMAEFYATKLNVKRFREILQSDYDSINGYDYDGIRGINKGKAGTLEKVLTKIGFKVEDYEVIPPKRELTDDEIESIVKACTLRFFTVETLDDKVPDEFYTDLDSK